MTKYLLIIWIGVGQSQTLAVEKFDNRSECEAVAQAAALEMDIRGWFRCVPYTFEEK